MNIEFKSVISRDGEEDQVIQFNANAKIFNDGNLKSWEFEEPSNKIMNLVEVKDKSVMIFAGAQTIAMKLQEKIPCEYQQQGMPQPVYFDSFLENMEIEEDYLEVKYALWSNQKVIGNYLLTIKNI